MKSSWRLYQYFSFSLLITERPVLTLVSQQNVYAFEGMDVFFEAQVKAGPYSWVSLSHVWESNENVIQRTFNVSSQILMKIPSITKANSGDYVLYAENAVGNDTVTVRLYVEGKFILLTCTHWCQIPEYKFPHKRGKSTWCHEKGSSGY